jgi:hypothetical protein
MSEADCPQCGEQLEADGLCPQCATTVGRPPGRSAAKWQQDQRRREQMRAACPRESFTIAEIGERDGWICGLCQDAERLVDASRDAPRALSPSIDHIVAVSRGGAHTRENVRITHLWCNTERNSGEPATPELMRAWLTRLLDGTPIPEELNRSASPSWRWPANLRIEYMIALYIAVGRVAADPRYGDPASRLADVVHRRGGDTSEEAMRSRLDVMEEIRRRRAPIDARWREPR